MALNLSDPGAILAAYESITTVGNNNNWLLLKYSNYDELFLADHGSGGLRELRSKVEDFDRVFIAFYRHERDVGPIYLILNYIPPSLSGVKRARALVHSRRIGKIFKKHLAILTFDEIAQLTPGTIIRALEHDIEEPARPSSRASSNTSRSSYPNDDKNMGRAPSQPLPPSSNSKHLPPFPSHPSQPPPLPPSPTPQNRPQNKPQRPATAPVINTASVHRATSEPQDTYPTPSAHSVQPIRRAFSESQNPSPPTPPSRPSRVLSNFIRRKKAPRASKIEVQTAEGHRDDPEAPPIPPKDRSTPSSPEPYPSFLGIYGHTSHGVNVSEFAVISHEGHEQIPDYRLDEVTPILPLTGKWAPQVINYEERLRQRREAIQRQKEEEEEALREEERRKEEARKRKEEQRKAEIEEDEQRKIEMEDELKRAAQERRLKEELERHEEERARLQIEERKRAEKARRIQEHKKLEEWRTEQARLAGETARKAEDARKKEEHQRKQKIEIAEARVKMGRNVEEMITGWVTMQTQDSLTWKRRYFKFVGTTMYLYRSPKEMQDYTDKIQLRGKIRGLREWKEGYEELEAIPFSFVIEFNPDDEREAWSVYADSEEEKYKLLGLLHHAAGL